jgi:CubicO group peptidase (beta-lactamase class C family)
MNLRVDGTLDGGQLPRVAGRIAAELARGGALGGQIWVEAAGRPVADAGFGEARPGEPMTRAHLMAWMSTGKPVAAAAILRLWELGALELDDPVARHLPEFAAGGKEAITVRHLLTHTAGLRMLDTGWPGASWEEILARIAARRIEPRWTPGRKAGYHLTSSWFVLGELVRRLDGRRFERWVREELFEPLGAADCWIGMPEERHRGYGTRLAPMFEPGTGGPRDVDWQSAERATRPSPGASGWGPIGELARFYRMLAAGGEIGGRRYLSRGTVEAMTARHRVGMLDHTFRARLDWGLGVIVNSAHYGEERVPYGYGPHAGPRAWGHSGSRSSVALVDPDVRLVALLAWNGLRDDEAHRLRMEEILAALYEDLGLAPTVVE